MNYKLTLTSLAIMLMALVTSCGKKGFKLEQQGDVEIKIEMSVPDLLKQLADNNERDSQFRTALEKAISSYDGVTDFVDCFANAWHQTDSRPMAVIFANAVMRDKVTVSSSDADVVGVLREEVRSVLYNTELIIRNRLDKAGYAASVDHHDSKPLVVVVAHDMDTDEKLQRLHQMVAGSGLLEFWETYEAQEIIPLIQSVVSSTQADTAYFDSQADETLSNYLKMYTSYGSMVGMALISDTAKVNGIVCSEQMRHALPTDLRLLWGAKPVMYDGVGGSQEQLELYALRAPARLLGDCITSAKVEKADYNGAPVVNIEMNTDGARHWATITRQNIGRTIAMVIDDHVYTAPRVNCEITGGRSQIAGNFTLQDCKEMAAVLSAAPLPVPVRIISERRYESSR